MRITPVLACLIAVAAGALPARGEPSAYSQAVTLTPLLKTSVDGAGRPIAYPSGNAEITAVHVEIAPGQQTNWHTHPVPCVAYVLEGELELQLANGERRIVKGGQAIAEVVELLHNGRNVGAKPAKLVLFALGTTGQPYAVKATTPPAPTSAP